MWGVLPSSKVGLISRNDPVYFVGDLLGDPGRSMEIKENMPRRMLKKRIHDEAKGLTWSFLRALELAGVFRKL